VDRRCWAISLLFVAAWLASASYDGYDSAKRKMDSLEAGQVRSGARVVLSFPELNAWAARQVPAGVRNPHLRSAGRDLATGTALVDFARLERSAGHQPGWLMSKLLEGERPVGVTVRIRSSSGRATVDIQRVEVSGIVINGRTLEFLIQNVFLPMYPDAVIGRPFELGHNIDRLDVSPAAVAVLIR
jgi:hypothetical protein